MLIASGTSAGLTDVGSYAWHQSAPGLSRLLDTAEAGDAFGYSLAVGDFNGDGFDDLAIGVPFERDESGSTARPAVGAIHVVYGIADWWLAFATDQFWHQDSTTADGEMPGVRGTGDAFGTSLAAGDLNGDGYTDLAIGVPWEERSTLLATVADAGAVNVLYGRASDGLSLAGAQLWHQDSAGVTDTADADDLFGLALAIGDFNGDGCADLAAGVPGEGITSNGAFRDHAGAVAVLHGSGQGVCAADDGATAGADEDDQFWHQNSTGVADTNETHDHFGGGRPTP